MSFLLSIFISLQRLCCPEDNEAVTIEPIHRSLTTATLFYNLQSLWRDSVTLLTATDIIMSLCSADNCIFVCEFMKRTAAWPRAPASPHLHYNSWCGEEGGWAAISSTHAPINECKLSAANWDRLQLTPSPGQHSEHADGKYLH